MAGSQRGREPNSGGPARRSVRDRSGSTASGSQKSGSAPAWKSTGASSARDTSARRSPNTANRSTTSGAARSGKSAKRAAGKGSSGKKAGFWNYPRRGKGPIRRWLPSWRFILASFLTVFALGVGLFAVAYVTTDVPDPEEFAMAEGSTVYFNDGETAMGSFAEVDRQIIDPATLPDYVGNAVVASEDRRFYSNVGVDPIAIMRAFWNNLRGNPIQGGSTLTQQYVERYYTGQTTSYAGKFREAILALKIDREQAKDEILGNYLNTIYFGRGAYGIERASQEYFGHPAEEMTLSEAALIAGIIPSPSNWDPTVNPDQAEQRWNRTLDYMVDGGFITAAERESAEFPEVQEQTRTDTYAGPNGYLLHLVRSELIAAGLTEAEIDGGGLQINTTIDPDLQDAAVEAAQDLPEDAPDELRVALSSVDNETGAILAMYGGSNFLDVQQNSATQDVAQGGSTFKVFTLVAALEEGLTLEERYPSYSPMEIDGYDIEVSNFDSPLNRGNIDLVHATRSSVNTAYVQLNRDVGPENTVDSAIRMGVPEDTEGLEPVLSNVLGTASPHNLDMARAYATLGSGGERHENYIVDTAIGSQGNVLYTGNGNGERAIEAQVAADATYAMTQVVDQGTGFHAQEIGRPAAAKTGTSNNYRSAWFVGFVPQITTSVSMYQVGEDGSEVAMEGFGGEQFISGSTFPAQIWTSFMAEAVQDLPVEEFPERSAPVAPVQPPPPPQPTQQPTEEETTEEPTEEPTDEPTDDDNGDGGDPDGGDPDGGEPDGGDPDGGDPDGGDPDGGDPDGGDPDGGDPDGGDPDGGDPDGGDPDGGDPDGGDPDGGDPDGGDPEGGPDPGALVPPWLRDPGD